MNDKQILIAIVGRPLSGKDMVAHYLSESYGFAHESTSDLLREHIAENNLGEPTRELMHHVANDIRKKSEPGVLVKKAISRHETKPRLIISAIRAKTDIDPFIDLGGIVIAVDAPIKDRYERATKRSRPGDNISFEQFQFEEEREQQSALPHEQNVAYVVSKATYTLENDGTIDDLLAKTDKLMEKLGIKKAETEK